jgi:hypothetical protein
MIKNAQLKKEYMTRKDYLLIAQEFRTIYYKNPELSAQAKNIIDALRVNLAIELAKENPRFNHYALSALWADSSHL